MIAQTLAVFAGSFRRMPLVWLSLLVLAIATNLVDLIYGMQAGRMFSGLQIASFVVRFFGIYWIAAIALRVLAGSPENPRRQDRGVVYFIIWIAVTFLLAQAVSIVLGRIVVLSFGLVNHATAAVLATIAIVGAVIDLIVLRFIPWPVALSTRIPNVTLRSAFEAMRGQWAAAAGGYLMLVFPLAVAHLLLTAGVQLGAVPPDSRVIFTVLDGLLSIAYLMMGLSLDTTATNRALHRSS